MARLSLDEPDEVADGFKPVNHAIRDFDAELIFNHYHQFEAVEPVSTKILAEARFIRDTFIVYTQILGNEVADLRGKVFVHGLCLGHEAVDAHLPISESSQACLNTGARNWPCNVTLFENFRSVALMLQFALPTEKIRPTKAEEARLVAPAGPVCGLAIPLRSRSPANNGRPLLNHEEGDGYQGRRDDAAGRENR
jgi:hypothetical protein